MSRPVKAIQVSVTVPRTMAVDFPIMSSSESRSRVAPWSGIKHEVTTTEVMMLNRWRFTTGKLAGSMPDKITDAARVRKVTRLASVPV
jgi:hypothetical protein